MKIGITTTESFKNSNKKNGEISLTNDAGLIAQFSNNAKILLGGSIDNATSGHLYIGSMLVQFGRVKIDSQDAAPLKFDIQFPMQFANNNVFPIVIAADNDPNNSVQINGSQMPTATRMSCIANSFTAVCFYYWYAIGVSK